MFTELQVRAIFLTFSIDHHLKHQSHNTYVFLEDKGEIVNVFQRNWDQQSTENLNPQNKDVKVLMPSFVGNLALYYSFWEVAAETLEIKPILEYCDEIRLCYAKTRFKLADVYLQFMMSEDRNALLPFMSIKHMIFYKAGEFELSPTYFIDGLSTEMWIFIWSFFLFFFLGLLISLKVYGKCFSHRRVSTGDVAMYQMNFIANQTHLLSTNEHERFYSWRIQMICQSAFNIIIACAFSAFILALLSIKTTKKELNSLDDFVAKRTHMICNYKYEATSYHFTDIVWRKIVVKPKFKGIYNEEVCLRVLQEKSDQSICESNSSVALVSSIADFKEMPFETCPIIQLKDIFPKYYGSFLIRHDFKYRGAFNRIFIQMQSTGILQRIQRKNSRTSLRKNYDTKREYKVYAEGVQFAHVRYIIYGFALSLILSFFLLCVEIIHYRLKYVRHKPLNV